MKWFESLQKRCVCVSLRVKSERRDMKKWGSWRSVAVRCALPCGVGNPTQRCCWYPREKESVPSRSCSCLSSESCRQPSGRHHPSMHQSATPCFPCQPYHSAMTLSEPLGYHVHRDHITDRDENYRLSRSTTNIFVCLTRLSSCTSMQFGFLGAVEMAYRLRYPEPAAGRRKPLLRSAFLLALNRK